MVRLPVVDRIGPICVAPDDGERVRSEAREFLRRGEPVCLDFTGASVVTPPFLADVIGALHGEFANDFLANHLTWTGLGNAHDDAARRAREKAIFFYAQSPAVQARLVEAATHPVEQL